MRTEPYNLISEADGLRLAGLYAAPDEQPPIGLVQLSHGMAEHKERYLPFLEVLTDAGYACAMIDHRGHGESVRDASDLGYLYENGDTALVTDLNQAILWLKSRHPGLPLCLFGHSMGSLVVRAYAARFDEQLDALVVCGCPTDSPATGTALALVNGLIRRQGDRTRSAFVDRLLFGRFSKPFSDEPSRFAWLNTDTAAVKAYEEDPLCGFCFTLNGFAALLRLMKTCYDPKAYQVKNPTLPILFISGSDDPCMVSHAKLDQAAAFLRKRGYARVTVEVFENMRHEILLAPEHHRVESDVLAFLRRAMS